MRYGWGLLYASILILVFPCTASAQKNDILLGQIASTSNPAVAEVSHALQRGYALYFDKINAQGGIAGRKIRLIEKDDDYNAQHMLALTRDMLEQDNVVALVGYLGTPGVSLLAQEKLLVQNEIALIAPSSGVAAVLGEPNMFPVRATYEDEIAAITRHAQSMGLKKIAMLTWTAGAGPALAKAWPGLITNAKLELVENSVFTTATDAATLQHNLEAAIAPVDAAHPQAVFLVAGGNAMVMAVKLLRNKLPGGTPIYTVSAVNWKEVVQGVGKPSSGVIISQCVPYPYSPILPIVKQYLDDIKAANRGDVPSYYGLEGYLGAMVTVKALQRAGPNITRAKLLETLAHMGHMKFGGFEIDYQAATRTGYGPPDITIISSTGQLVR